MSFLNEQVLFWTFSAIAQALAALVTLSAMVAFYVLRHNAAMLGAAKNQLGCGVRQYGRPALGPLRKPMLKHQPGGGDENKNI